MEDSGAHEGVTDPCQYRMPPPCPTPEEKAQVECNLAIYRKREAQIKGEARMVDRELSPPHLNSARLWR